MRTHKTKDGIADVILKALLRRKKSTVEEIGFTAEQDAYFKRLIFLDNLYRQHYPILNRNKIWKIYRERFDLKSKNAFYQDEINCQKVFGTLNTPNKDYMRQILSERLNFVYGLAITNGDLKAAVSAIKEAAELLQLKLPDVEELERTPTRFELNLTFNLKDGQQAHKVINIDEIQNMPLSEFKGLTEMLDRPRVSVEDMAVMLKNEQREDT